MIQQLLMSCILKQFHSPLTGAPFHCLREQFEGRYDNKKPRAYCRKQARGLENSQIPAKKDRNQRSSQGRGSNFSNYYPQLCENSKVITYWLFSLYERRRFS